MKNFALAVKMKILPRYTYFAAEQFYQSKFNNFARINRLLLLQYLRVSVWYSKIRQGILKKS
jgi:hypothetical protein